MRANSKTKLNPRLKPRNKTFRSKWQHNKQFYKRQSVIVFQLFVVYALMLSVIEEDVLGLHVTVIDEQGSILPEEITVAYHDVLTHITDLVHEIHAKHPQLLINVDNVFVSTESIDYLAKHDHGHPHILGAHGDRKIILRNVSKDLNERTLYHEIGHAVWSGFSKEQKAAWTEIFEDGVFVSSYSKKNPNENFAETFACFFTDFNSCQQRMTQEQIEFLQALL